MPDLPLTTIRWALVASLSYLVVFDVRPVDERQLAHAFVAMLLATTVVLPRALRSISTELRAPVALAADTAFVLAGLAICDSTSQDLLVVYFVCILVASIGDSETQLAGGAFLVTAAYALWTLPELDVATETGRVLRLPFVFVTTVFYGVMMHRLRRERRARLGAESRLRELEALMRVTRLFAASPATDESLERVSQTIRTTLGLDGCRIHLLEEREPADRGAGGICGEALERSEPVMRTAPRSPGLTLSILAIPIVHELQPLGVLLVEAVRSESFTDAERHFLQVVANAAAPALRNARHHQDLAESERTRLVFLKLLARHFRTPTTAILGYAELAKLETPRGPRLERYLQEITWSAQEMYDQAERVEELSGLTASGERRRAELVDLRGVLLEAVEAVRGLRVARGVDISLVVEPDLPRIKTDGEKLRSTVESLLVNALRSSAWCAVRLEATVDVAGAQAVDGVDAVERRLDISIQEVVPQGGPSALEKGLRGIRPSVAEPADAPDLGVELSRRLAEFLGGSLDVDRRAGEGTHYRLMLPVS